MVTTMEPQQTEITKYIFGRPLGLDPSADLYRNPPNGKLNVNDRFEGP
jgi:hypothetical protein